MAVENAEEQTQSLGNLLGEPFGPQLFDLLVDGIQLVISPLSEMQTGWSFPRLCFWFLTYVQMPTHTLSRSILLFR